MDSSENETNGPAWTASGTLLYTLASRDYFEPVERIPARGDYRGRIAALLPRRWIVQNNGIWYHASAPGSSLPDSGFKIHVSSTLEHAAALLGIVLPMLVAEEVRFKVLKSANHLALANSKFFPRAAAHKFITIYPATTRAFVGLAQRLERRTARFDGPRVLSDKPVNGSRVVSYRFGGFRPAPRMTAAGTIEQLIRNNTGGWIPDVRTPYFALPEGVQDPFPDAPGSDVAGPLVLADRFLVTRALAFSTCGGTYIATDRETGSEVLVKEARPLTTLSHTSGWLFHACDAMRREQVILERLSTLSCVPRHIAAFDEGGHAFSVQEYIPASPFAKFRAQDSVLLAPFAGDADQADAFCETFASVAVNLIAAVIAIHRRRVIVGDISAGNILVHEDRRVSLIDFESSWDRSWSAAPDFLSKAWSTAGFARGSGGELRKLTYKDDWYAVGMVMFSMLLPVNRLNGLDPQAHERFLDAISETARLPQWIAETIRYLLDGKPAAASALLRTIRPPTRRVARETEASCSGVVEAGCVRFPDAALRGAVAGIADHILGTLDVGRRDVLGPSDYRAFQTNPLSVAYGACGPLLFLASAGVDIPEAAGDWLDRQTLSHSGYPPGLHVGLSGIACTLWKLGREDRAVDALSLALDSPLLYRGMGFFQGAAGCGFAALQMYLWTRDRRFLIKASEIGRAIVPDAQGWGPAGPLVPGIAEGASGIALFLLYLGVVCEDEEIVAAAKSALELDIRSASRDYRDGLPRWAMDSKDRVWTPYWLQGGCGIGSVLVRFHSILGEERYLSLARDVARANYSRFSVLPGQFEGLAGIGEFMFDMSLASGEGEFEEKAAKIVDSILMYAVPGVTGLAFPGRSLARKSNDFGYGSSGIGLFLDRVLHRKSRLLHDLEGLHR